jgi:ethanolamine ammonia-lyase large subunit
MATFSHAVGTQTYRFDSLKDVMAKASPARSGDFWPALPRKTMANASRRKWHWPTSRSRTSCKKR